SAFDNVVQRNKIGTSADGTAALPNLIGMDIFGPFNSLNSNLISGNSSVGVQIETGAHNNQLSGNNIGTNVAGNASLANDTGIDIFGSNNTVGFTGPGAGNLISGNITAGVRIESNASINLVQGNTIGVNNAGAAALGNSIGVDLLGSNNTIGGDPARARKRN